MVQPQRGRRGNFRGDFRGDSDYGFKKQRGALRNAQGWNRNEGYDEMQDRNAKDVGPPKICINFAMHGTCHFQDRCRFLHSIRNVGLALKAHAGPILCAVLGSIPNVNGAPAFELFTGGKDNCVKRWIISAKDFTPATAPDAESLFAADALEKTIRSPGGQKAREGGTLLHFNVIEDAQTPFEAPVSKLLLAADCLFCGLQNGVIRGFHRSTGSGFVLQGHEKEIQALTLVDNILISGDFSGFIRFWKPGIDASGSPCFTCVQTFNAGAPVKVLKEHITSSGSKYLLVGGLQKIGFLDLQRLEWVSQFALTQPNSVCMDVVNYDGTYLSGLSTGELKVLGMDGQDLKTFDRLTKKLVMCLEGAIDQEGPILLLGQQEGLLSCCSLPSMQPKWTFMPHDEAIRELLVLQPAPFQAPDLDKCPCVFISVSSDACIGLWAFSSEGAKEPNRRGGRHGR